MTNIILRDYQESARKWANQQINASRHCLVVMPCGTGKSKTAAMLTSDRIKYVNEKVLLIVPQDIIQEQLLVDFAFLNAGYINQEGVIGKNRNVYIAMAKSLYNLLSVLPENFLNQFTVIITDETQFSSAETWRRIYSFFPKAVRVGFTGTPYRMDNQPMGEFYSVMFEPITISQAITKGYLCKPVLIVPEGYKDFIPTAPDINIDKQREHIKHKKIIGNMLEWYNNVFNGLPVIIPAVSKEHAEEILKIFSHIGGWNAEFIHGFTSKHERKRVIREIKSGKINQLIVVGVGIYGMDIPNLAGIMWARYTESLTVYMQLNGRPMRPTKNKDCFVMIDFVGNSVVHGRADIDRKWSLHTEYTPKEMQDPSIKMKICPACSVMNAEENITCHICGYDFRSGIIPDGKKRKLPVMIDGKLIILDADKLADRKEAIQESLREQRKKMNEPKEETRPVTKLEKINILKNGLESKSGLFADAIKNYL